MSSSTIDPVYLLGFVAGLAAWCVAAWSLWCAIREARKASAHLPSSEQHNYLVRVVTAPFARDTQVLLKGRSVIEHREATRHVRRARIAISVFLATVLSTIALGKMLRPDEPTRPGKHFASYIVAFQARDLA